MPRYQVLRPIEHNGCLYLPDGYQATDAARSAGNGRTIPTNTTGVIELTPAEAGAFGGQQLRPVAANPGYGLIPIPEPGTATESPAAPAAAQALPASATPEPVSKSGPEADSATGPAKPAGRAKGK